MTNRITKTACPLDCPDTCSIEATLDERGRLKLDGDRRNPATDGYLCQKVRRFPRHLEGADRILRPAVRVGAKGAGSFEDTFREVSWDEALDRVAEGLRETAERHGGEAILPFSYGGSNGLLTQNTIDLRLFRRLGASRLARTVCAAANSAANAGLYGKMPGVGWLDYPAASLIVVWGANPSASGIHLVPPILEAKRAGAKLVVIDPRRTPLAKQADLHLSVRPGTDLPLALALVHWLFAHDRADHDFLAEHATGVDALRERASAWTIERAAQVCGLDAEEVERFARLYADASPAVIRLGWGLERNRNGGSATAAILALPAIAGKFGVPGGGFTASNSGSWKALGAVAAGLANEDEKATRVVNMNRLGRALLDPPLESQSCGGPIHALFVYNANPLATLPRQDLVRRGLEREDLFTVVHDAFLTDTARFADVLLPATTFLEHQDLRASYGTYVLQTVRPVIEPVGESRSNGEVFEALVERLGLSRPDDVPAADLYSTVLDRARDAGVLDASQLRDLKATGTTEPGFGARPIQFVDVFPYTSDAKIHLCPESLDSGPRRLYDYVEDPASGAAPLTLISPATSKTISSMLGDADGRLGEGDAMVDMHPDDASARGLETGGLARITNDHGELVARVRATDEVRPGVVSFPKGLWMRASENGWTSNVLVPDTYTDLGEGACFNDARVEVARAD